MTLLDECVKTLGNDVEIIEGHYKKVIVKKFRKKAPLREDGRINWETIEDSIPLTSEFELKDFCEDGDYYIIWDNHQFPVLKASLDDITKKENIYSVMDVSFDTWILSEDFTNVVEIDRNRDITYKKFIEMDDYDDIGEDESIFKRLVKNILLTSIIIIITAILIGFIHIKYGS